MPFTFDFDPDNRILRACFDGRVTDEEFRLFSKATVLYIARTIPLAGITDMSNINSWEVTAETLRAVAEMPPGVPPLGRKRVVVVTCDRVFDMMYMFQHEAEITRPNFYVVRTMEEARAILRVQELRFKPIGM